MVGFALAIAKLLAPFWHQEKKRQMSPDRKSARLTLNGAWTFVWFPQFAMAIESIPRRIGKVSFG